jgi:hypothetical protein
MSAALSDPIRAAALCLLMASCARLEPPPSLKPPPDLTLRDVHIAQFHGSVLTAAITTVELQYTRDTGNLEGRHGTLLPQTGSLAGGRLTAGLTIGSTRSGAADLSDSVHWDGPGGDRVDTTACAVDFVRQVVKGSEPVAMAGDGYTITGQSFESRYGTSPEVHLTGGVQVHVTEEIEGQPE